MPVTPAPPPAGHEIITANWLAEALVQRAEIRTAAGGGGGQCSIVTEWAALDLFADARFGYGGYYIDRARNAVIAHFWVNLPDGWLLDLTADQFGEGDDYRLLAPGDPRRANYLFDWDDRDTDPGIPDWDHWDHIRDKRDGRLWCEAGCHAHGGGARI